MASLGLLTQIFAVIGAVLGIYNFIVQIRKGQTHLRVNPTSYLLPAERKKGLCIQVINLSGFDVTVEAVGLALEDSRTLVPTQPVVGGYDQLPPRRLKARDSFTVYFTQGLEESPDVEKIKHAFARTSDGKTFKRRNKFIKDLIAKKGFFSPDNWTRE